MTMTNQELDVLELIKGSMLSHRTSILVSLESGFPVSALTYRSFSDGSAYIIALYTLSMYRGLGHATKLIQQLIEKHPVVSAQPSDEVLNFYENLGFKPESFYYVLRS